MLCRSYGVSFYWCIAGIAFAIGNGAPSNFILQLPGLVAGLLLVGGLNAAHRSTRFHFLEKARRKAFYDEFGSINGWLVDLMVLQGHAPTGRDRGVVWFEEGRLFFTGERTSFGLSRSQVVSMEDNENFAPDLRLPFRLTLSAMTAAGNASVTFSLLAADRHDVHVARWQPFSLALNDWLATAADGEGQLPPLSCGPGVFGPSRLLQSSLAVTTGWIALIASFLWGGFRVSWAGSLSITMILIILLFAWGHFWHPRLVWLAWRDRMRLEKGNGNA